MAIFGVGAYFFEDVTEKFLEGNCACLGYDMFQSPPAHGVLRSIKTGDILYIKKVVRKEVGDDFQYSLVIKAVGVCVEGRIRKYDGLGAGVAVDWVWDGDEEIGQLNDRWPIRGVCIYEEYHPQVHKKVLELLLGELNAIEDNVEAV